MVDYKNNSDVKIKDCLLFKNKRLFIFINIYFYLSKTYIEIVHIFMLNNKNEQENITFHINKVCIYKFSYYYTKYHIKSFNFKVLWVIKNILVYKIKLFVIF